MPGDIGSTRANTRSRAATVVVLTVALVALMLLGGLPGTRTERARAASASRFDPPATTAAPPTATGPTTPASTEAPVTTPLSTPDTSVVDTAPVTDPPVSDSVPYQNSTNDQQSNADNGQQQNQQNQQSSDTAPMTTTEDLLVGPSTTPAPTTTVRRQDLTTTAVTRKGGSSDPKIWMIVAALVLVAVGLGLATFLYWRRTRPGAVEGPDRPDHGSPSGRGSRKRGSRFSDLVITVPKST